MVPVESRDYILSEIYYSVLKPRDVRNIMYIYMTISLRHFLHNHGNFVTEGSPIQRPNALLLF